MLRLTTLTARCAARVLLGTAVVLAGVSGLGTQAQAAAVTPDRDTIIAGQATYVDFAFPASCIGSRTVGMRLEVHDAALWKFTGQSRNGWSAQTDTATYIEYTPGPEREGETGGIPFAWGGVFTTKADAIDDHVVTMTITQTCADGSRAVYTPTVRVDGGQPGDPVQSVTGLVGGVPVGELPDFGMALPVVEDPDQDSSTSTVAEIYPTMPVIAGGGAASQSGGARHWIGIAASVVVLVGAGLVGRRALGRHDRD